MLVLFILTKRCESGLDIIAGMARGSVGSVSEPYFGSEPVHNSPCHTSHLWLFSLPSVSETSHLRYHYPLYTNKNKHKHKHKHLPLQPTPIPQQSKKKSVNAPLTFSLLP